MLATKFGSLPRGIVVAKKRTHSGPQPSSTTVNLGRTFFDDLWWVARCEGKGQVELLRELIGTQLSTRLAKYAGKIAAFKRLDEETARKEAKVREAPEA